MGGSCVSVRGSRYNEGRPGLTEKRKRPRLRAVDDDYIGRGLAASIGLVILLAAIPLADKIIYWTAYWLGRATKKAHDSWVRARASK